MADSRLTAQQRAELARMQLGQPTLMHAREEYALEFVVETMGGRQLRVETTIRYEDGIPALARLRQIVLALDAAPGLTVLAWRRTFPAWPAEESTTAEPAPADDAPATT
jgi:hypothetical protein